MTVYTVFLECGDPGVVQDISPTDTILVTVGASYGTTGTWLSLTTAGCTLNFTSGSDGSTTTLTPISGASSYSVTFRTRDTEQAIWYSTTLSGTISAGTSDTTPDAFTFTDQTNVALNSTITSSSITVSGINAASAISVSGGTYSINGGAYTSSSGTVTNGQTVSVQHTSSASNSTATNTTLTIGGVSDVFTSTTVAAAATPTYSVSSASTNEGASATANVTTTNVANGTTLYWTVDATTADVSITSGSFTISSNVGSFTIPAIADSTTEGTEFYTISVRTGSTAGTVVASSILTINDTSTTSVVTDTTPNAFIFADQSDVAVSTVITSAPITVIGINSPSAISIVGGTYSTDDVNYTSVAGTVTNGQTVRVRHTSSSANSAATNTTLTIGGISDVFTSTTIGAVGSGNYGLQIFDSLGNITLDTSDITIKDLGIFSVSSVTANGTITGVPLTSNSIALVNNNNGDGDTAIAAPAVTLAPASSSIIVSGGTAGFNVSIRVMEF